MNDDPRPVLRRTAIAAVAVALVLTGVVLGTKIGPRVVTVERKIIAPAIRAARPGASATANPFPDVIQAACPAIVAIEDSGDPGGPAALPPMSKHRHHRKRKPTTPAAIARPLPPAGFIVASSGYVITSSAALSQAGTLHVHTSDGRRLQAQRAGIDAASGLALLKIDGTDLPTLEYADTGFPESGETAVTLATPQGSGCIARPAMVAADFLAEGGRRRGYVRLFPAPDMQFAGAPAIGADGRVIGIAGLAPSTPAAGDASELLPASVAASITSMLLRGEGPTASYGLVAVDLDETLAGRLAGSAQQGAVIMVVQEDSPADKAGLRAGDVVLAANRSPVSGASELARALDAGGGDIVLEVLRGSDRLSVTMNPIAPKAAA